MTLQTPTFVSYVDGQYLCQLVLGGGAYGDTARCFTGVGKTKEDSYYSLLFALKNEAESTARVSPDELDWGQRSRYELISNWLDANWSKPFVEPQ